MFRRSSSNHVLVLNQFAQPRSSAGGTRHVEIFGRMTDWESTILAADKSLLDQSPVIAEPGFETVYVTRYSGNGTSRLINWVSYSLGALLKGLTKRQIGLVYGSSPHMGAAFVAWLLSKRHRAPFVLEVRDLWPHILVETGTLTETSRVYRALKVLERFLYRQADAIVIMAEGSRAIIAAEGIDNTKMVFVPNGADPADFDVTARRADLREQYGFEGFCVVYAGAHGPANGLDYVLDAAQRLTNEDIVHFHLVGGGPAKHELQLEAKRRRLKNVHFHDPVPKDEIARVFAAADAGLHCLADHDLFTKGVSPNKLYDYMAAGLPVITNTRGEVAAIVEDAGAGFAVGPDEIELAARKLANATPDSLEVLGENGRAWMIANRSRAAMASRLEDLFDSLGARR